MADDDGTIITRSFVVTAGALFVALLALSVWAYARLPDDALVPMHWGIDGQVDRYAGKLEGLFLLVGVYAGIVALLMVIPRIEPRRANLVRSAGAYRATAYAAILFMAGMHVVVVATALGRPVGVGRVVPLGVGVLLVVIGNWLPKVRSNFLFGVRTPWTLTSEHTWRRTHRVAGRAFVGLGIAIVVAAALLPPMALAAAAGGGAAALTVGLFAYSYVVWRDAPDRRPRNGQLDTGA